MKAINESLQSSLSKNLKKPELRLKINFLDDLENDYIEPQGILQINQFNLS